jgi:acyl dehydratase
MHAPATVYWEDIAPGALYEGGRYHFDEATIKRFAAEFDPRPTHLDADYAATTFFKGLCASGAHTFAAWARLNHDITPGWALQAGSRVDELRLLRPVRLNDTLSLRLEILGKKRHPLRADFGFVEQRHTLLNRRGKPVLTMLVEVMIQRREPAP